MCPALRIELNDQARRARSPTTPIPALRCWTASPLEKARSIRSNGHSTYLFVRGAYRPADQMAASRRLNVAKASGLRTNVTRSMPVSPRRWSRTVRQCDVGGGLCREAERPGADRRRADRLGPEFRPPPAAPSDRPTRGGRACLVHRCPAGPELSGEMRRPVPLWHAIVNTASYPLGCDGFGGAKRDVARRWAHAGSSVDGDSHMGPIPKPSSEPTCTHRPPRKHWPRGATRSVAGSTPGSMTLVSVRLESRSSPRGFDIRN